METLTQLKNRIYGAATGTTTSNNAGSASGPMTGNSADAATGTTPSMDVDAATGTMSGSDAATIPAQAPAMVDSGSDSTQQYQSSGVGNESAQQPQGFGTDTAGTGTTGTGGDFHPDIENATNREITPDAIALAGGASVPIPPNVHVFSPQSTTPGGNASSIPSSLSPDGVNIGQELGARQAAGPVGGHSPQEAAVAGGSGLNELEQQ